MLARHPELLLRPSPPSHASPSARSTARGGVAVVAAMGRGGAGAAVAVTLWWLAGGAGAVWLELATTATKCLSEEIQSNVVVIGDYSILFEEHPLRPKVSAKVTSPYGDVLHRADNVSHGQFAFTTAESGIYLACFWVETGEGDGDQPQS